MAFNDLDFEAADAVTGERSDDMLNHADRLIRSEPTTLAGAVALMRYVASLEEWQELADRREWEEMSTVPSWHQIFLDTMARTLERISAVG